MPDEQDKKDKVSELKDRGNECVRAGNLTEAVVHYSQAIKHDPGSPHLYSNRSLALLRLTQYHHALQDANQTIKLDPLWAKGYYRRGEVFFTTQHYAEALESYRRASQLQADQTLLECVLRANRELLKQDKMDRQMPWVGAGMGLILGVLVVVGDAALAKTSVLSHPILQALLTIVFSMAGLGLGYCYRWFLHNQRKALLEPPFDLLGEQSGGSQMVDGTPVSDDTTDTAGDRKHHARYNKAQARQRYKKGKS